MASSGLVDIDHGYKAFMDASKRLAGKPSVKVGFLDGQGEEREAVGGETPPSNIEVAIWAEFGTRTEPERSFMRSTFDENRDKYRQFAEKLELGIMHGKMDEKRALGLLGEMVAADIRKKIASNLPPPNAESTLAAKFPKTHTLVDSGQMAGAVTAAVDMESGGSK